MRENRLYILKSSLNPRSDLFMKKGSFKDDVSESFDFVHKAGLKDSFTNWTDPILKFNPLTQFSLSIKYRGRLNRDLKGMFTQK